MLIGWRRTWHWKLGITFLLVVGMIALDNAGYFPLSAPNAQGFSTVGPLQYHPLARLFEFTLGMSAALAWQALAPRLRLGLSAGTVVELVAVALVVFLMYNTEPWSDALGTQSWVGNAGWTWLRLAGIPAFGCAALIVVFALQWGLISRVLCLPQFVLLGELSYSIYLLHVILVVYFGAHANSFTVLPAVVALLGYVAILLLLSYVTWSVVEKPCKTLIMGLWQQGPHSL